MNNIHAFNCLSFFFLICEDIKTWTNIYYSQIIKGMRISMLFPFDVLLYSERDPNIEIYTIFPFIMSEDNRKWGRSAETNPSAILECSFLSYLWSCILLKEEKYLWLEDIVPFLLFIYELAACLYIIYITLFNTT